VGSPDLLAEAGAAASLASISPEATIKLCTLGGARALGLEGETGSLVKGKWADCAVLRLGYRIPEGRLAEHVLGSTRRDLMRTCVGGRDVYRAP
jgi:cytosine/adenosine deaminase-related metal-dependent hydrolase